jgi:DNA-binding XRE family transcriptional regulator
MLASSTPARHICRVLEIVAKRPRSIDNQGVPPRFVRYLAQAIRERRESLGPRATQEEIAYKARISVRHLQKIENGLINPRLDTLLALASALRTNLQTLLDRAEELAGSRAR